MKPIKESNHCEWCGEYLPQEEGMYEKDLGHICDKCYRAMVSRGEELELTNQDERRYQW